MCLEPGQERTSPPRGPRELTLTHCPVVCRDSLCSSVLGQRTDTTPTATPLSQSAFGSPLRICKTFSPAGFLVWIPNNHMKNSILLSQARWATGRLNSWRSVSGKSPQSHGPQDFQSLREISSENTASRVGNPGSLVRPLTSVPGSAKLLKILMPRLFVEFFPFIYLFTSDTFVL